MWCINSIKNIVVDNDINKIAHFNTSIKKYKIIHFLVYDNNVVKRSVAQQNGGVSHTAAAADILIQPAMLKK